MLLRGMHGQRSLALLKVWDLRIKWAKKSGVVRRAQLKEAAEERCLFAGTSAQKNNFKPNKYYILKTLCWCVSSHFDEDLELH